MFPLLGKVSEKTGSASTSSFQTAIMIHHSRDTAQKQWAETQVEQMIHVIHGVCFECAFICTIIHLLYSKDEGTVYILPHMHTHTLTHARVHAHTHTHPAVGSDIDWYSQIDSDSLVHSRWP